MDRVVRVKPSSHIDGIEGLRGIAALLVLFHHVGSHLSSPEAGILYTLSQWSVHGLTLFFALSGFLLYRPFAGAMLAGNPMPSLRRYLQNRFVRIYPAYIVVFALVSLVFGAAYTGGAPGVVDGDPAGFIFDPTTLVVNALLIQTYIPGYLLTGVGPAWSLTAEILFYLLLPLMAWGGARLASTGLGRWKAALAPALAAIACGLSVTLWSALARRGMTAEQATNFSWGQTWTAVVERSFFANADLFGYGMVAAVVFAYTKTTGMSFTAQRKWILLGLILVLGAVSVRGMVPVWSGNVAGMAAALLILVVALPPSRIGRETNRLALMLEAAPLRYSGDISYSIYLWHVSVIWWLDGRGWTFAGEGATPLALNTILVAGTTIVLAALTFHLVEQQFMKLRKGKRQPALIASGLG